MAGYTSIQDESFASDTYTPYNTTLPSQATQQEIEELSNTKDEAISLRSAPPGGTPIGGVPLGDPSALTLLIPLAIYLLLKKKKSHSFFHKRLKNA